MLFLAHHFPGLASGGSDRADLFENLLLLAMGELVQALLDPSRGFDFIPAVASTPQIPEVLATVPEVQQFSGLRPALGLEVPNLGDPIAQHQGFLGSP